MAERDISNAEQLSPIDKKKRNFFSKGERLRKTQSKRRACTPEPGRKVWTDDSEKDASDADKLSEGPVRDEDRPRLAPRTRNSQRKKEREVAARRTRSAERARPAGTEGDSEEDFEVIRSMHKSKELEEERVEKLAAEPKPKTKDEPRAVTPKEMPPLIVAPPDLRKRARHKVVTSPEEDGGGQRLGPTAKDIMRRRLSTSEEEEEVVARGKYVGKSRRIRTDESERKARRIRRSSGLEKTDASESDGRSVGDEDEPDEPEEKAAETPVPAVPEAKESVKKQGWLKRWFSWRKKPADQPVPAEKPVPEESRVEVKKERLEPREWFLMQMIKTWRYHKELHRDEYRKILVLKNKCLSQLLLMLIYCGFGGIMFRFVEGAFESFYKCGVKRVKRDFIDSLWSYSQYMREDDWKSQARRKLMDFENQLHTAHEAGMTTYSGQKSWSFLNAVVYCLTVITTIGYGHISPSTTTGRAITIIYAIFGIPMFLILLADFGKLFTRGIKFLWAFVRRLYYTGSCKKVRKTAPVQEMMKGVQYVYDFAKNRRASQWNVDEHRRDPNQLHVPEGNTGSVPDTPGTPNLSAFEIDDEFNLPISVAITILLIYIFFGATIYWTWEDWSFFESFYFVFISMSTIGFGDFVPQNPVYMMASIIYLVFGLALTSMCINVVQEKLTDTFRQASTKIGATIGLRVAEDGTLSAPPELADVDPLQNVK
ncbi:UNVERIFIED_CONTAM: hypothetical protein PYX00_004228 [Menopon gallinae]|uniref:Potassium channel domain-containing protein n=1 Tax=Menopon gallinae TaxID=328185 RepID=A0AAW2I2U1_9NEOP